MKTVGAAYEGNGRCRFTVWAPEKKKMLLQLVHPQAAVYEMQPAEWGYFTLDLPNIDPGTRYYYKPEGAEAIPDPASYFQPEGVHGPSEVVDHGSYTWRDTNWQNIPLQELILYELHVGTFTAAGTFEAIIPRLDELKEIGINAIELMPVAQFPGERNWGYDAVYPYAVQQSYGGPTGLKKLVDACHTKGIAVYLDVIYNHLGPEGNYFEQYGPYFTDKFKTPWGKAINYDGAYSNAVREYVANNTLYWLEHFHIDGLRLDAIHTIFDQSAISIWELIQTKLQALTAQYNRPFYLIAESDLNDPRVVKKTELGGFGFDAQWLDDFHHALYVLLDREGQKYYEDFGAMEQLSKALTDGFVHSGEYVKFRKKTFGASSASVPGNRFIAFTQNHDQVGNRIKGERLTALVGFEQLKLAAAAMLLAPYIPMLFMGEEYAEEAPFLYFVDHSDKDLIKAVQEGRKAEFSGFKWKGTPPDPQSPGTYQKSKLNWDNRREGHHAILLKWYKALIDLRRSHPALQNFNKADVSATAIGQQGLVLQRQSQNQVHQLLSIFNFSEQEISYKLPALAPTWQKVLFSDDAEWRTDSQKQRQNRTFKGGAAVKVPALSVYTFKV